jgi:uncharacterized protein with von Willebrand factor type A (vWA) domain
MIIKNLDNWDRREFIDAMEYNNDMADIEKQGSTKTPLYAEFMTDIFGGLYKYSPKTRNSDEALSNQWADDIYNEISNLQEWRKLRERTVMNAEAASAATVEFCKKFMNAIPNLNDEKQRPSQEQLSQIRNQARTACEAATIVADETNETIEAFTYRQSNQLHAAQHASPTAKKELAKMLSKSEDLKNIAKLAGKFKRIAAQKQKTKTKKGVDEIANITIGNNLSRLIPTELMKIRHPNLKLDFHKKYLESSLLQYELKGKQRKEQGPIIMCVDESGSMRGHRDIWAKAIAMALIQITIQQKREFYLIHFSSKVTRTSHFKYPISITELMSAVTYFSGGGTNFMEPLNEAIQIISNNPKTKSFKNADIIFVSDGDATITSEWLDLFLKAKNKGDISVMSILIGLYDSTCKHFSDHIFYIKDIKNTEHTNEALSAVLSI